MGTDQETSISIQLSVCVRGVCVCVERPQKYKNAPLHAMQEREWAPTSIFFQLLHPLHPLPALGQI